MVTVSPGCGCWAGAGAGAGAASCCRVNCEVSSSFRSWARLTSAGGGAGARGGGLGGAGKLLMIRVQVSFGVLISGAEQSRSVQMMARTRRHYRQELNHRKCLISCACEKSCQ